MVEIMPQTLTSCSSGRRTSNASNSPEFEFWMVRNPSCPEPNLHSADELFSDGVILPLHLLHHSDDPPDPSPELQTPASVDPSSDTVSGSGPDLGVDSAPPPPSARPESLVTTITASRRWKDIFKKDSQGKKSKEDNERDNKKKKKERKAGGGGGNGTSAAELNIYLWPFSRSRSAGTGGSRPRMAPAVTRKVSSAPCSRSNSAGESKSRKWPASPSRGGVHLGRNSPIWQVRRNGSGRSTLDPLAKTADRVMKKEGNDTRRSKSAAAAVVGVSAGGAKAKGLNLNVPMCIGYRHHLSCRSDENSAISIATAASGSQSVAGIGAGESGRGSNLFNFRSLFTKKVY